MKNLIRRSSYGNDRAKQGDRKMDSIMNISAVPPEERHSLKQLLFSNLDAEKIGVEYLRAMAAGAEKEQTAAAARYFRERAPKPGGAWRLPGTGFPENADRAVRGEVTVTGIPWTFPDGHIDWHFNPTLDGPRCTHEWLWQLNRMNFWPDLAEAYRKTGDEKYAAAFNTQLESWLAAAGPPPSGNWNSPGSLWRTIETGLRLMHSWNLAFETFRTSSAFSDENLCLMLGSMFRHACHLRDHHKQKSNWMLMEMSGLYTFGVNFPEFKTAPAMREYAAKIFGEAITAQILPDGMHDELSPDYHQVLLGCVCTFLDIGGEEARRKDLPSGFLRKMELTFDAILQLVTPGLTMPRTNDSYTVGADRNLSRAVGLFPGRADFRWAASARKTGTPPESIPSASRFLPWCGFAAMRSDWGPDALYCCFDAGPLGMAHMHQDKLNINIYKGDEELICDDGGGQYEISPYRVYALSAADHNTCLVDGLLQRRTEPRKYTEPADIGWISNSGFDYARAVYDGEFGPLPLDEAAAGLPLTTPAVHLREIRFCKPDFFCIADTLRSLDGAPHDYELRFHLDTLKMEPYPALPGAWLSDFGRKYDILIVPLQPDGLESRVLQGVTEPPMAGWFVGRNDRTLHKSSTVAMTVKGKREHRFLTLLIPVRRSLPLPQVSRRSGTVFEVRVNDRTFAFDTDSLDH